MNINGDLNVNNGQINAGTNNTINTGTTNSSILGGSGNTVNHDNSHIIGSDIASFTTDTTHVEKLNINTLNGTASVAGLGIDINGMVVSATTGGSDTFISGMTFNNGTYDLTIHRNDGTNFTDSLSILSGDMVVTGGTYDINTGIVEFTNNSGGTFNVSGFTSGMTDSYTTTATTSGNVIQFDNNIQGSNLFSVDLSSMNLGSFSHSASGQIAPTNAYGNVFSGTSNYSSILGGNNNNVDGTRSVIAGGYSNTLNSNYGFVGGGGQNTINTSSDYSLIGGGLGNTLTGYYSTILGGKNNTLTHNDSNIIGSNITSFTANTTHVEKLNVKTLNGTASVVGLGIDSDGMVVSAATGSSPFEYVVTGTDNIVSTNGYSIISGNPINSLILNGGYLGFSENKIIATNSSKGNTIINGSGNYIQTAQPLGRNFIGNGHGNQVNAGYMNTIINGYENKISAFKRSTIINGKGNEITGEGSIVGGNYNTINGTGSIIGGSSNVIGTGVTNTTIIGGSSQTATVSNSVYVPALIVTNSLATKQVSTGNLTGTLDDYDPGTDTSFVSLRSITNITITGTINGTSGKRIVFYARNIGASTVTLKHQDVGSTAANRFLNGNAGADIVLSLGDTAEYIYDSSTSRWIYLGGSV